MLWCAAIADLCGLVCVMAVARTSRTNLNVIIAVFVVKGFFESGLYTGTTAMATQWFDGPKLGRVFALRGVGSRAGTIVSSWVVGALLTQFEWPTAVRGAALVSSAGLAWAFVFQRDPKKLEDTFECFKGGVYEAPSSDVDGDGVSDDVDGDVENEKEAPGKPPICKWMSDSRFWTMNFCQMAMGILLSVEGLTPIFVTAVLKPEPYISALLPSCISIGIIVAILGCGAWLEKKNQATRHLLTLGMLAVCALECFIMLLLVAYIDSSSVCTTVAATNATVTNVSTVGLASLSNASCVTPADLDGFLIDLPEANLEASGRFDVSATCDTDKYFTGAANASVCADDGGEYTLSGCEYNSCLEKEAAADSGPVEVCTNPWHGSMALVVVFAILLTIHGLCIGYGVYVPPWVFVGQFGGANSGTMGAIYEVSSGVGALVYIQCLQVVLGTSGWTGVWVLEFGIACLATISFGLFTLMDCQAGDEFTGGRFDDNEIKTLFARIDTGNDGAIEKDELERFLVGTFDGRALPRLVRYTVHRID